MTSLVISRVQELDPKQISIKHIIDSFDAIKIKAEFEILAPTDAMPQVMWANVMLSLRPLFGPYTS